MVEGRTHVRSATCGRLGRSGDIGLRCLAGTGRRYQPVQPVVGQSTAECRGRHHRPARYRIVQGGSTLVVPVLERIDLLSLEVITISVKIGGAYTKEGVPVSVETVAVVKIRGDDVSVRSASERFLGMTRVQIHDIVNEALTGHLRSILGILTVEEINVDRQAFASKVAEESAVDLERMGVGIDVLTVQHISDDLGYLDSLGRRDWGGGSPARRHDSLLCSVAGGRDRPSHLPGKHRLGPARPRCEDGRLSVRSECSPGQGATGRSTGRRQRPPAGDG
ncbi:MAG: flotillin family protein [Dehalococcoidia bacterium]|nr:flotillin family protein [Dehalococcoidia bacterium]